METIENRDSKCWQAMLKFTMKYMVVENHSFCFLVEHATLSIVFSKTGYISRKAV